MFPPHFYLSITLKNYVNVSVTLKYEFVFCVGTIVKYKLRFIAKLPDLKVYIG